MLRLTSLNRSLRWLLQIDQPAVSRTDAEISAEVEQNYRWNFTVNLLDGASFWFGVSFISSTTIVPLFISKLTDSTLAIGLVAVIAQGSWFLPQLFTANLVERLARKKTSAWGTCGNCLSTHIIQPGLNVEGLHA